MGIDYSPAAIKRQREFLERQNRRWRKAAGPVVVRRLDPAELADGQPLPALSAQLDGTQCAICGRPKGSMLLLDHQVAGPVFAHRTCWRLEQRRRESSFDAPLDAG